MKGPLLIGLLFDGFLVLGEIARQLRPHLNDVQIAATWLTYKNEFLLGIAALIVWRMGMRLIALIGVAALMFLWDHALEPWYYYHRLPDWALTRDWLGLVIIACVVVLAPAEWPWMRRGMGRALSGLGTISYSLYITHPLVAGRLVSRLVAAGRMPSSAIGNWLSVVIEMGLSVGAAALFYLVVERPAWRWSKRLAVRPARP